MAKLYILAHTVYIGTTFSLCEYFIFYSLFLFPYSSQIPGVFVTVYFGPKLLNLGDITGIRHAHVLVPLTAHNGLIDFLPVFAFM